MMQIIGNALAIWFCICVFTVIFGITLANRIPAEAEEDETVLRPQEPYVEPEQLRIQREAYVSRRDPVVLAIQRERAELQAVRGGK